MKGNENMNRRHFIHTVSVCLALLAGSHLVSAEPKTKVATLSVSGMMTPSCPVLLKAAVKKVDGVTRVEASLAKKTAWVTFHPGTTNPAAIIATIEQKTPYKAQLVELRSE